MARMFRNGMMLLSEGKVPSVQVRFYPRWNHRKPLNVYTPEEYENTQVKPIKPLEKTVPQLTERKERPYNAPLSKNKSIKWTHPRQSIKFNVEPKKIQKPLIATHQNKIKPTTDMFETIIDADGNFVYKKLSNNDSRIGIILTQVKSKKEKIKNDLILLEGKRLIKDALIAKVQLKYLLFSRRDEINELKSFLPKIGVQLFKMPYKEMQMWSDVTTNPGIMGLFTIPDVEQFKPNASLPITVVCDNVREPGNLGAILRLCAAVGCERVLLTKGCVNVWDTKVLRSAVGAHFKLKIHRNLNWGEIEQFLGQDSDIFIADNRIVSINDDTCVDLDKIVNTMPLLPYFGVDFKQSKQIALIIGGETHGISNDSYQIASRLHGCRLNIPLENDVDSLNVGAAMAVIGFEMKRQFLKVTQS